VPRRRNEACGVDQAAIVLIGVLMTRTCPSCGAENRVPPEKLDRVAKCGRCKQALGAPDQPVVIETAAEFRELVGRSALPVLVDFWAPWCGPCRTVAPEVEKLAQQKAGRALVAKVDTERVPEVAAQFGIRSIPTFVRFDGGKETKRISGAMGARQLAEAFGV
jgi:thioredoxin 2